MKIQSQEEQWPDRVAHEKAAQEEEPYLRMKDVSPRIHLDMGLSGMDPEKQKEFEDAFVRKMLNEVGDPSLPKVPPRRKTPVPRSSPDAAAEQMTPSQGRPGKPWMTWPEVPRPDDYSALEPSSPEDWEQLTRTWLGPVNAQMYDTPRKLKKRVQETQHRFTPWENEDWRAYDVAPNSFQPYADWKRQQAGGA